jgi:hypothetical protein
MRLVAVDAGDRCESSDACRLAPAKSAFLVTTDDWAQAASDAAPTMTANL